MLDTNLVHRTALRKAEKHYGISFVYMVQENDSLAFKNVKNHPTLDCFKWNAIPSYHITLLRCKSKSKDFSIPNIECINDVFTSKKAFLLVGKILKLDNDGIVRYKFNCIPQNYWNKEDIIFIEKETGLKYTVIYEPWITIGYVQYSRINMVAKNYDCINNLLSSFFVPIKINVETVFAVKYSDTSFNHMQILQRYEMSEKGEQL